MSITDLYDGDLINSWIDEDIITFTSALNAVSISMPSLDFLKFVKELNKVAVKAIELQKKEFEE